MKKTKKKANLSSSPNSTFFSAFIGEFIEIICKNCTVTNGEGIFPYIATGYLLDVDEEHLYLSVDGKTINGAIKRSDYVGVSIVDEETEASQLLSTVSTPDNPEEGN